MPTTPSYPGVYIEEVPSDVKTIVGVATARTAFVGRALRGPLDEPVRITSFGDFERRFGGLWRASTLGYAVRQYFQNGGGDAVIVRVSNPEPQKDANGNVLVAEHATATASLGQATTVRFEAATAGAGGNGITVAISRSSVAGQANDPARFDAAVTGTDSNGHPDTRQFAGRTLAQLQGNLANAQSYVTMPSAPAGVLLERATATLAGGADAVAAWQELKAGASPVAILEAVTPGVAGNTIAVTVGTATDGTGAKFNLTISQGATSVELEDQTAATLGAAIAADATAQGLVRLATDSPTNPVGRPPNGGPTPLAGGADAKPAGVDAVGYADPPGVMKLEAANPGLWGNRLTATVNHKGEQAVADAKKFNLLLEERDGRGDVVALEAHLNVSVDSGDKRRVDRVLATQSAFARLVDGLPAERPPERTLLWFAGGADGPDITDALLQGSPGTKTGLFALEKEDLFNILCIPPPTREGDVKEATWTVAMGYCEKRRAMLLVDPPRDVESVDAARAALDSGLFSKLRHPNVVFNFPLLEMPDPLMEDRPEKFVPSAAVAGLYARTDAARGVWKAPAGQEASLRGVHKLAVKLTDPEHGYLNPLGLNCARTFPVTGTVMWGARTSRGADQLASEWKYVPVRRTALYIEETLFRGTQWVVFEPNDEDLWAQIRLNVGAFMHDLFRKGAFQGASAKDAYFVKCDGESTPQSDIDKGIVNILVGFAPLKPAEFVFVKLSQMTKRGA
ncbi:MAG: uncharacterized protein QOD77_266 [Thermoplasmata archaeon]|jgi:phage tail sheath protein FI|nr:uncharacterized protein [Thermoplasmata archaeon]